MSLPLQFLPLGLVLEIEVDLQMIQNLGDVGGIFAGSQFVD